MGVVAVTSRRKICARAAHRVEVRVGHLDQAQVLGGHAPRDIREGQRPERAVDRDRGPADRHAARPEHRLARVLLVLADARLDRVDDIPDCVGLGQIDGLARAAVEAEPDRAPGHAQAPPAPQVLEAGVAGELGLQIDLAEHLAARAADRLGRPDRDRQRPEARGVGAQARARAPHAVRPEHLLDGLPPGRRAPEDEPRDALTVGDAEHRIDDALDHDRLGLPLLRVGALADLGQGDAAGLLEQVAHLAQPGVERAHLRVGEVQVLPGLRVPVDPVVELEDRRGLDDVVARAQQGHARRELGGRAEQGQVRAPDVAHADLAEQHVGGAPDVAGDECHVPASLSQMIAISVWSSSSAVEMTWAAPWN
jgi:hypothetical protein